MSIPAPTQRYRAEIHTFAGRHSQDHFENVEDAHVWVMAAYAKVPPTESAAVIFDDADGQRRVFVIDPNFVLPSA